MQSRSQSGYIIKQIPDDFVVKEDINLQFGQGNYSVFLLQKTGVSTQEAIRILAAQNKLKDKMFGYAGNKDARAITSQAISIKSLNNAIKELKCNDKRIKVQFLGTKDSPISLGDNNGNFFEIVIRNIESRYAGLLSEHFGKTGNMGMSGAEFCFPNYFGTQRFVGRNAEIGLLILKGEFAAALGLIGLNVNASNGIAELRALPKRQLKMYIHAYQSLIFNRLLKRELIKNADFQDDTYADNCADNLYDNAYSCGIFKKPENDKKYDNEKISLPGFGTMNQELEKELSKDGLTQRSFIIRAIPGLSEEGGYRLSYATAKEFRYSQPYPDELNQGKLCFKLSFWLPKGSYATVAIDCLMKSANHQNAT